MALFEGVTTSSSRQSRAAELAGCRCSSGWSGGSSTAIATDWPSDLDAALEQRTARCEIINDTLLAGMKTVGELFGSGQMQLPFVLQSAEVMKAAVAHLEPHMEKRRQRHGKGTLVLATVKGDVHDIGKNLVDIILSNNGYEVVNLGIKQPISAILRRRRGAPRRRHRDVRAARQVDGDHEGEPRGDELRGVCPTLPVLLGGAALTRAYVENDLAELYPGRGPLRPGRLRGSAADGLDHDPASGAAPCSPTRSEDAKLAERKARRERSLRIARRAGTGDRHRGAGTGSLRRGHRHTDPDSTVLGLPGGQGHSAGRRSPRCSTSGLLSWASGACAAPGADGPSYEELVETEGRPRLRYWLDRLTTKRCSAGRGGLWLLPGVSPTATR